MADTLELKVRVPDSVLPFPDARIDQLKFIVWKVVISPFFMSVQNLLVDVGILSHGGRQEFPLGFLAPGKKVDEFVEYLNSRDFKNHFIAWKDDGQLVSLRRLDGFRYQYHLRVFNDGEVRAHYEYTPEAHPIWHMREVGIEERRAEFLNVLGDWIAPSKN